jgi:hypothetical protein
MSARLSVIATAADASLAGMPDGAGAAPAVALGSAAAEHPPALRWLERAPRAGAAPAPGGAATPRLMAPAGEGLWRVAPWPAADALFELPAPAGGRAIVAGADESVRGLIVERAAARGVAIHEVHELDARLLADSACVILAEPDGVLPARSFAVLAARRLLIVPRPPASFGLEDGLDHLEFDDPEEAVTLVEAYRRSPEAFARVTAWGRAKVSAQRASVVYGRLAADLRLQGLA